MPEKGGAAVHWQKKLQVVNYWDKNAFLEQRKEKEHNEPEWRKAFDALPTSVLDICTNIVPMGEKLLPSGGVAVITVIMCKTVTQLQ